MAIKPLPLALVLTLAATSQAPAATPAKPAAKPAPAFNARDPASLIILLQGMGAKAAVTRTGKDEVLLGVTTPAFGFGVEFAGCQPGGKACQALAFSSSAEKRTASLAQINGFNQTSITCRVFQDPAGKTHVMYSALLSSKDTPEEIKAHVGVWQGCLASFGEFLADPNGYLAAAP